MQKNKDLQRLPGFPKISRKIGSSAFYFIVFLESIISTTTKIKAASYQTAERVMVLPAQRYIRNKKAYI